MLEYSENRYPFVDICSDKFGRKVITTNATSINYQNIQDVLGNALVIHNKNQREIDYLDRYYRGDQPILYRTKAIRPEINNKMVENRAFEIVEFMAAQNFGEPMQYVSNTKESKIDISEQIDKVNKYMDSVDKWCCDLSIGRWRSICGTAYRFIWKNENADSEMGDAPFSIDVLDPRYTFVVYSSRFGKKPLMSVQIEYNEKNEIVYCCYTENAYYEVSNGNAVMKNNVIGIPVIEYPNNERRISDIEVVITLADALNKIQSNRMDGIEQFIQAFMKFINCDIDKDDFLEMCQLGAVKVKAPPGVRADVDVISSQLDQGQTQISKDDVYKAIISVLGMPSREQNTGGDTGQAVYLRNGWDFAEQRAEIGEPVIKKSERAFLRIALKILNNSIGTGIKLKLTDIDIKITRSKTDNMLVKTQALGTLLDKGIDSKTAIKTSELWSDPEKVYLLSKEKLDKKFESGLREYTKGGEKNAKPKRHDANTG